MKNEIRLLRLRRGLTQAQLAKEVGVSQQAVAKWESEEEPEIGAKYLPEIAKALGVKEHVVFPSLRKRSEMTREEVKEVMEVYIPRAALLYFKGRKSPFYTVVDKTNERRISAAIESADLGVEDKGFSDRIAWFHTVDGMLVAFNVAQIRRCELGTDLTEPRDDRILPQDLFGEDKDEESFEEYGDLRRQRLFVKGRKTPFLGFDGERDFLNRVMSVVSSGMFDPNGFITFYSDAEDDIRWTAVPGADLQLLEVPKSLYEAFEARIED